MGESSFGLCSQQLTGSFTKGYLEINCEFCKTDHHRAKCFIVLHHQKEKQEKTVFAALDLVFKVICPCLMLLQSIPGI